MDIKKNNNNNNIIIKRIKRKKQKNLFNHKVMLYQLHKVF